MHSRIINNLPANYPWKDLIQYFSSAGSTNDILKALAKQGAPHGTAILAGRQTNGHGRLGRTFHSPEGMGIYLSILLRPGCSPVELMHLTCAVAVAICDAVETVTGLRPGIKWTNDLVFGKKKLGGILTELGLSPKGTVDYAILGIGINCHQKREDFPEEIRDIAASLDAVTGSETDNALLVSSILQQLHRMNDILLTEKSAILEQYRKDCVTIGREISVVRPGSVRHGTAVSVDDEGALVVIYNDSSTETVNSGEVSIRGMYGYL